MSRGPNFLGTPLFVSYFGNLHGFVFDRLSLGLLVRFFFDFEVTFSDFVRFIRGLMGLVLVAILGRFESILSTRFSVSSNLAMSALFVYN